MEWRKYCTKQIVLSPSTPIHMQKKTKQPCYPCMIVTRLLQPCMIVTRLLQPCMIVTRLLQPCMIVTRLLQPCMIVTRLLQPCMIVNDGNKVDTTLLQGCTRL